ncbi:MAG: T9SS type A sorting domain-containing protein, partial [Bacteroidota bacterium]
HHWAAPDPVKNPQDLRMRVSPNRYWKIDGLVAGDFAATAQFFYDGRVTNGNAGFLDNDLIGDSEDSLHLLYRAGPHEDWVEFPYYSRNDFTNATDKFGLITMDSVWLGEYTLAVDQYNVGIPEATPGNFPIKAYPNPAGDVLYFEWPSLAEQPSLVVLHDVQGREVLRETIQGRSGRVTVAVDHLPEGTYIYTLRTPSGRQWNNRVVIKH